MAWRGCYFADVEVGFVLGKRLSETFPRHCGEDSHVQIYA